MKTINNFKFYIALILIGLTTYSCKQTQHAINSGDYDYVIDRSVEKLQRNKTKSKHILNLEEAFTKANRQDLQSIERISANDRHEDYVRIYDLYARINQRQKRVAPLLPLFIKKEDRKANIALTDIGGKMAFYRDKAAESLYAQAQAYLNSNSKYAARDAYRILQKLDSFYPNYKDTRSLIGQANIEGSNHILFEMKNNTGIPLPPNFYEELHKMSLTELDDLWAVFHTKEQKNVQYDYKVEMNVLDIDITPERLSERIFTKEKTITDGWQYALDKRGNVLKDSLGNDIKVDIVRTVRCDIVETRQQKEARIRASVDFIDLHNNQLIGNYPVSAGAGFDHRFGNPRGDLRALDKNDARLCDSKVLPFPADMELLLQAAHKIKPAVKNVIARNDDLVLN